MLSEWALKFLQLFKELSLFFTYNLSELITLTDVNTYAQNITYSEFWMKWNHSLGTFDLIILLKGTWHFTWHCSSVDMKISLYFCWINAMRMHITERYAIVKWFEYILFSILGACMSTDRQQMYGEILYPTVFPHWNKQTKHRRFLLQTRTAMNSVCIYNACCCQQQIFSIILSKKRNFTSQTVGPVYHQCTNSTI